MLVKHFLRLPYKYQMNVPVKLFRGRATNPSQCCRLLPQGLHNFKDLVTQAEASFGPRVYCFEYKDETGEAIKIQTDEDLEIATDLAAARSLKTLRVFAQPRQGSGWRKRQFKTDSVCAGGDLGDLPAVLSAELLEVLHELEPVLVPGASCCLRWRLRNSGGLSWPAGTRFCILSGAAQYTSYALEVVEPWEAVEVSADLVAPDEEGQHVLKWALATPTGEVCGDSFELEFTVRDTSDGRVSQTVEQLVQLGFTKKSALEVSRCFKGDFDQSLNYFLNNPQT